ncbi:MAG: hypothetical protein JNM11_08565 [Chitinimonas sp.]|nr:hypothetical protein [Chitinimonas sp.]
MILTKETWKNTIQGYSIYDCAIRSADRQCFLLYEKQEPLHRDSLPAIRFVFTYNDEAIPQERYYFRQFNNFRFARLAFNTQPVPNYVAVDTRGQVYSYDQSRDDVEHQHPDDIPGSELAAVVTQVARIGQNIYTVSNPRRTHKHTNIDVWEDLTKDLPVPADFGTPGNGLKYMWSDIAGFTETDIYAVGGLGDVWHYDGQHWTQCSFPSNELLNNVCCADDGNVYIGGNMGSLYVGKGNTWKKLSDSNFSVPWKDIAWFAGKLWCGSDYGLWELRGGVLIRAEIPANVQLVSGAIDISPDKKWMLTAGPDGAALFDGTHWEVLFSRHDLED